MKKIGSSELWTWAEELRSNKDLDNELGAIVQGNINTRLREFAKKYEQEVLKLRRT